VDINRRRRIDIVEHKAARHAIEGVSRILRAAVWALFH